MASLTGVNITTVGSGYSTAPTITISGGTVLAAGTAPTGTGNATNFRFVNVTITNAGSGYTSPPTFTSGTVSFSPQLSSVVLASGVAASGGAGDLTIAGVVSGAAANTLTKVGAGTLTLSAANTYTGQTFANAGTLLVNGNQSAATGNVTVNTGGTLGGTGTVGGVPTRSLDRPGRLRSAAAARRGRLAPSRSADPSSSNAPTRRPGRCKSPSTARPPA